MIKGYSDFSVDAPGCHLWESTVKACFKLLLKTICKQCGYLACMASGEALNRNEARFDRCPDLNTPGNQATDTLQAIGIYFGPIV